MATKIFNDGHGDCQIVHKENQTGDLDLLIVPIGSPKLPYAHHVAFEAETPAEFEAVLTQAKKMGLKTRTDVPLESEAGVSRLTINGKIYQHFYVLDPSWVNVEIMSRIN